MISPTIGRVILVHSGTTGATGPRGDKPTEAPPQSVTAEVVIERSQPGTRTARGRDKTAAALKSGAAH